jgi:plastocyanin
MPSVSRHRFLAPALVALALAVAALLFAALSPSGDTGTPATASAAAKTVTVNIKDYAFAKKTLTVKKGTTVKWVNKDDMEHTVTADVAGKGGPNSKLFAKGKSYSWKATKKGTFKYHCKPHTYMKATVIVK